MHYASCFVICCLPPGALWFTFWYSAVYLVVVSYSLLVVVSWCVDYMCSVAYGSCVLLALHVLCCWFVLWCLLPGGALLFTFLFLLINLLLLIDALLLNNQPSSCFPYNQLTLLLQPVSVIVVGFSPKPGFFDWNGKSSHHHESENVLNWIQWVSICLI